MLIDLIEFLANRKHWELHAVVDRKDVTLRGDYQNGFAFFDNDDFKGLPTGRTCMAVDFLTDLMEKQHHEIEPPRFLAATAEDLRQAEFEYFLNF